MYDQARYFTITGRVLIDVPGSPQDRQAEVDALHGLVFAKPDKPKNGHHAGGTAPPAFTDAEILSKLAGAKNAAKWTRLYNGDISGYASASEADLAAASLLAFYTTDAAQILRIVRGSKLDRDKWGREDYATQTIGKAVASVNERYTPRGQRLHLGGKATEVEPPTTTPVAGQAGAKTGCQIIVEHFRQMYRPQYRNGAVIRAGDGRDVSVRDACDDLNSALIERLAGAENAPKYKGGSVNENALPGFFRTWAKVAWGDLLKDLKDEDDAELAAVESARDEFRRMVRDALLSECTLAQTTKAGPTKVESRIERDSLIGWCVKFAKEGPWRSIRGKQCWCKIGVVDAAEENGGEQILRVAIRHSLFAQVRGDRRLIGMGENKFTRRAKRYDVGTSTRNDRPHGQSAVVLNDEFVADLASAVDAEGDQQEGAEPCT
jgi:hypothetical protein